MNVQLDKIFHSLSDGTRRDILHRLTTKELSVSEIAKAYEMSLAAVSKHLKVLERANLVSRRREGKKFYLKTEILQLKEVDDWMEFYRKYWNKAFDQLDDYLTQLRREQHE